MCEFTVRFLFGKDALLLEGYQRHESYLKNHYPNNGQWVKRAVREIQEGRVRTAIGVFHGDKMLGSAILKKGLYSEELEIKNILTLPEHEICSTNGEDFCLPENCNKDHVRDALLGKAEKFCESRGYLTLVMEMPTSETRTISYFIQRGYKISSTQDNHCAPSGQIYILKKKLKPLYSGDPYVFDDVVLWLAEHYAGLCITTAPTRVKTREKGSLVHRIGFCILPKFDNPPGFLRGEIFVVDNRDTLPGETVDLSRVADPTRNIRIFAVAVHDRNLEQYAHSNGALYFTRDRLREIPNYSEGVRSAFKKSRIGGMVVLTDSRIEQDLAEIQNGANVYYLQKHGIGGSIFNKDFHIWFCKADHEARKLQVMAKGTIPADAPGSNTYCRCEFEKEKRKIRNSRSFKALKHQRSNIFGHSESNAKFGTRHPGSMCDKITNKQRCCEEGTVYKEFAMNQFTKTDSELNPSIDMSDLDKPSYDYFINEIFHLNSQSFYIDTEINTAIEEAVLLGEPDSDGDAKEPSPMKIDKISLAVEVVKGFPGMQFIFGPLLRLLDDANAEVEKAEILQSIEATAASLSALNTQLEEHSFDIKAVNQRLDEELKQYREAPEDSPLPRIFGSNVFLRETLMPKVEEALGDENQVGSTPLAVVVDNIRNDLLSKWRFSIAEAVVWKEFEFFLKGEVVRAEFMTCTRQLKGVEFKPGSLSGEILSTLFDKINTQTMNDLHAFFSCLLDKHPDSKVLKHLKLQSQS